MPISQFANPGKFSRFAERLMPWFGIASLIAFAIGLYLALIVSPPDYQQGETVRIMYIHVPAAWMSLGLYVAMAAFAGIGLVQRHTLADVFCVATAPIGASLTALCLITGSIWGKPTWGTWWVWDARLTSVLLLFFLYCGYIVLRQSFDDHDKGGKAGAIFLLLGVVNIPIIHFSVEWWNTLHQPASVFRMNGPAIAPGMLKPLLVMALAYALFAGFLVLLRMRSELTSRRIETAHFLGKAD